MTVKIIWVLKTFHLMVLALYTFEVSGQFIDLEPAIALEAGGGVPEGEIEDISSFGDTYNIHIPENNNDNTENASGTQHVSYELNRDILILSLVVLIVFLFDPLKTYIGTVRTVAVSSIPQCIVATRKGRSQDYLLLNLISFGDGSAETAMCNANITHIQLVEEVLSGVKFIFLVRQTVVTGYNIKEIDC